MSKKVSVYLKAGENAAVTYYRFSQYFREMNVDIKYNLMIPDNKANSFLPISKQPLWKKVYIFFYIYFRTLKHLIGDYRDVPDVLVISRRIIDKLMPYSYCQLLTMIKKKGCKIVWDFDDQIIELGEVSRADFDIISSLADTIVVGSPYLKQLIRNNFQDKVKFLPTTDGDMFGLMSDKVTELRKSSLASTVNVIWVGTFSGLVHLIRIMPSLELLGKYLSEEGRQLIMSVVCDYPLEYHANSFILENIKWSRDIAIEKMIKAHVGVMPLEDTEIARGKCAFKLIQYLSVGLPVVGSDVGMNKEVISDGVGRALSGFETALWVEAFKKVVSNERIWGKYSESAYRKWIEQYSYNSNLDNWKVIINNK